jgi:hypothetical protein
VNGPDPKRPKAFISPARRGVALHDQRDDSIREWPLAASDRDGLLE